MSISGIGPEYRIKTGKEKVKTPRYWGNVRVKKDSRTDDYYIDVLIGKKDSTVPHIHVGINLDQSLRFVESRDELVNIHRKVDSKLQGPLLDETVQYKQGDMGARLTFTVIVDDPTKTIEIKLNEMTLSEK